MSSLASIFVNFVANIAGLQTGVQQAAQVVQQGAQQMQASNTATAASSNAMATAFERGGLRIAASFLGARTVTAALAKDFQDVYKNIENIPGIPQDTIDSVNRLKFSLEEANGGIKGYIATLLGWFQNFGEGIGYALGGIAYGSQAAADGFEAMNKAAADFAAKDYNAKFAALQKELDDSSLSRGQLAAQMIAAGAQLEEAVNAATQDDSWKQSLEGAKELVEGMKMLNAERQQYVKDGAAYDAAQDKDSLSHLSAADRVQVLSDRMDDLTKQRLAVESGDDFLDDPEALEQANDLTVKLTAATKAHAEAVKQLEAPYQKIVNLVGDDLTNAFVEAFNGGGDAFKNLTKTILEEIEKIAVQALLVKPIFASIGGLFGGGTGFFGLLGTAFSAYAGGFAGGGDIGTGQFALVGENGPELLAKPGTVISNANVQKALGGGGGDSGSGNVIFNVDATGADAAALARATNEIRSIGASIEKRAVAAVIQAKRRGGGTAAMLS